MSNPLMEKMLDLPEFEVTDFKQNDNSEVIQMATNRPRYTVSVDNELFQKIENFRFEHRYQTRAEATVELIRRGLSTLEKEDAASIDSSTNK